MKVVDLQIFVQIVETGSLTAVAKRRGVSQPAISRQLRDLESQMQATLLLRTGRGVQPTPAGQEFLQFAIQTLEAFRDVKIRVAERARVQPSHLRMSVPLRLGRLLIPDLYREFGAQMPVTNVHIYEEPTERAIKLLADGELDAALTYRSAASTEDGFVPLFSETLYAVGSAQMLKGALSSISGRALSELPLLLPSSGRYRTWIQATLRSFGCNVEAVRELETAEGLLAFATEGEGVAVLPYSNVYQEVSRGEVIARPIVSPEMTRVIGLDIAPHVPKHMVGPLVSTMRRALKPAMQDAVWRAVA